MAMSPEKRQSRKKFEVEIFILKYVLNHSESIPTKKKFSKKIFVIAISGQKWPTFNILSGSGQDPDPVIFKPDPKSGSDPQK